MKGDRGLIHRAASVLELSSTHTLDLAREVLGLSGNPGAASAAVFTLLGSDSRFHVDSEGLWYLQGPRPGTPLADLRYAVVDVETTGGSYRRGHRITEVAIYEVRDGVVAGKYRTLVNPGRGIPPRIAALTGITNDIVFSAPYFDQIAPDLIERLRDRVFIAHNARFDWGFVSQQLAEAIGEVPRVERLCTVRMARRVLPWRRCRNLDSLARHFDIEITARHRAHGDALATARVLLRLLDEAANQGLTDLESLKVFLRKRRRPSRPPQGQQLSLLGPSTDGVW